MRGNQVGLGRISADELSRFFFSFFDRVLEDKYSIFTLKNYVLQGCQNIQISTRWLDQTGYTVRALHVHGRMRR
jgi:hypothetical protein